MTKARDLADLISAGNPLADGAISVSEISDLTATAAEINQLDGTADLPDIRPSLLLDFANSKTLDPRITFSRGSTATYWDGKTTTKAEENLVTYSQDFANTVWGTSGATKAAVNATAPDGTSTAALIQATAVASNHYFQRNTSGYYAPISGQTYTLSCYLKAGTISDVQFVFGNGADFGSAAYINVDLSAGTITHTASSISASSITDVGNGWYRVTMSAPAIGSNGQGNFITSFVNPSSPTTRLASFTAAGTETYYLWGAQIEQRSSATAYTATTTSPIVKYQPVLQTAASGEARFDHDPVTGESKGLLIEEARTNLFNQSQIDQSGWNPSDTTKQSNVIVAPDGTLTGDKLIVNSATDFHFVWASMNGTASNTYTTSVFAKAGEYTKFYIQYNPNADWTGTGNPRAFFDLVNGTVYDEIDATGTIEYVGNGWYRCSMTATGESTLSGGTANLHLINDAVSTTSSLFAGDGYSGVYFWGAQLEVGSFPTSYIPTSGSTVTRIGEFAAMPSSEIGYYGGDFTVYSASTLARNNTIGGPTPVLIGSRLASSITPQGGNYHYQYYRANGASGSTIYLDNTIYADTNPTGTITANQELRIATAYSKDDFATSGNGGTVLTDASVPDFYGINSIHFGNGAQLLNGHLSKVAFWNERLPNATLQAMTEA